MKPSFNAVFLTVAAALLSAFTARADLRAAWEFNSSDISGATVNASGGTAANITGTLTGDADASTDILALDGAGDYLAFGNDVTDLRALPAMTICAWVRVNDTATALRRIVEHDDTFYFYQETGKYRFTIHGSGNPAAVSVSAPTPNVWQHVLTVYQGAGQPLKMYINGVLEHTTGNALAMPNAVERLTIGAQRNNSANASGFVNGSLDDVAIWNEALTDTQIAALAGLGSGGYAGRVTPTALDSSIIMTRAAAAIAKTTATLSAMLGTASPSVRLCWSEQDDGDGTWANDCDFGAAVPGLLTTNLTGLTAGTRYFFRFRADTANGVQWSKTGRFNTFRHTPEDFGGLQLWLRPDVDVFKDAGATVPATHGNDVWQWNDVSGNDRHAVRTDGGGTLVWDNGALNGLPGIRRNDMTNSAFLTVPGYEIGDTNELTVFMVSRSLPQTYNGSAIHPLLTSGSPHLGGSVFTITTMRPNLGGAGNLGYYGRSYNPLPYDDYTSTSNTPNFSDEKGHVLALTLADTATGGKGVFTGWYDGAIRTPRNGNTNNPANGPIEIGGSTADISHRYAGVYGDILIYDRVLSDEERNEVGWYLQNKYRLEGDYLNSLAPLIVSRTATAVSTNAATLNGELMDGPLPDAVTLYWGPTDGGTDPSAWTNAVALGAVDASGLISTNITGLAPGATYFYRFASDNNQGRTWSVTSQRFITWRELPDAIADLQLWLKADEAVYSDSGTTPATNGATVAQWNDFSGNARNAARIGMIGNVTYVRDALNGMPVIKTTDLLNSDYLRVDASYEVADNDDLTVFLVSRADPQTLNGSALHTLISSGDPGYGAGTFGISTVRQNAGGSGHLGYFGRGTQNFPYNNYTSTNSTPNFGDRKGHVLALRLTGASTGENGVFTGWYDGAIRTPLNGSNNNPANGPVEIGGFTGNAEGRYAGAFGDILIYNRALTDSERNRVGWYLQNKYGLTGAYYNPFLPEITAPAVTAVSSTAATLSINVTYGEVPVELTLHWGETDGGTNAAAWTHAEPAVTASALGTVDIPLSGLTPGTLYHARFSASNTQGTTWADTGVTFVTVGPPIVANSAPNAAGLTSAILEGMLIATSGAPTQVWIYWGERDGDTDIGAWQHNIPLGLQDVGVVSAPAPVTGLSPNTPYFFRLRASNTHGERWAPTSQRFTTAYLPSNIKTDGLVLWLRADMGVTHTGGLVDQWLDQATDLGGANNAAATGASRPVLVADAIGKRTAIRFDGVNDFLSVPDHDALDLGTGAGKGWTLFTVYLREVGGTRCIVSKGSSGSTATDWRFFSDGTLVYWGTGNSADANAWFRVTEPPMNQPHILAATLTQTGETEGTKAFYTNGDPHFSQTYTNKAPANTSPVVIGGFAADNANLTGLVAEVMAFNRTLNEDELNNVGWYLQEKYDIPGAFEYRAPRGTLMLLR